MKALARPSAEETVAAAEMGIKIATLLRTSPSPILAASSLSVAIAKFAEDSSQDPVEVCHALARVAAQVRAKTEGVKSS